MKKSPCTPKDQNEAASMTYINGDYVRLLFLWPSDEHDQREQDLKTDSVHQFLCINRRPIWLSSVY